ncbi:hypothetical protein ENUP19_0216G0054 [Entamoeba nuttalli]|uniref:Exportin 1 family protein n=2 Tax=Entamoeba nuttalli TaxID=412467 RepID=K2H0F6_ENTNP|nr:exportin 1 family protein [Entamoeba nuttalli P19]EKE39702.1 exportin 1 family protein [Entamoeba nuttalli P19]|eukprot:XP_008857957.1 exportin 1 family protein [Entamoeba nuttalli P19]
MEDIQKALHIVYGNGNDTQLKTQASYYLTEVLKKRESIQYFEGLMQTPSDDSLQIVKVNYGATILQKRLMYSFDLFPLNMLNGIKDFIFQKLIQFKTNNLIVKQLSLCIVALALQDPSWNNFMDNVVQKIPISNENNPLLLTLFMEIANASSKMDLIEISMRNRFIQIISQATPTIIQFIISICNQDISLINKSTDCLCSWIQYSTISIDYYKVSPLIPFLLKQLGSSSCEAISNVMDTFIKKLTHIDSHAPSPQEKEIIMNIAVGILQEYTNYTVMISRNPLNCFFEISYLIAIDLYKYVTSQYSMLIKEHLNQLILASDTINEDVIRNVSEAAIVLLETTSTRRASESTVLYEFLTNFARQMMQKVVSLHFDPQERQGEELEEFLKFRKTSSFYLFRKCIDVLGNSASIDILPGLWNSVNNKETVIAALIAGYEDFSMSNSQELFQIISSSIQYISQQQNVPFVFTRSLIIVLGKYGRFFHDSCPQVVPQCINFLSKFVGNDLYGSKTAKSMMLLSQECSSQMVQNLSLLKGIYTNVIRLVMTGKLKGNEKQFEDYIHAYCNVIGSAPTHEYLQELFNEPNIVIKKSALGKIINNETLTAFWLMKTIFIGLKRSKFKQEIAAVIIDYMVPQMLFSLLEIASINKNEQALESACIVIGKMFMVIEVHCQPFFSQCIDSIKACFNITHASSLINCLSMIADALYTHSIFQETLRKNCVPLLNEAMKLCTLTTNDLIIDCADCIFYFNRIKLPTEFLPYAFNWLLQFTSVPDQDAYHAICENLVDFINDGNSIDLVKQPTTLLTMIESVVHLFSKDRQDDCITVLREIYITDIPSFCNNMQLILQQKYTTIPNGFKQTIITTSKLSKNDFIKIMKELFMLLKETS